MCEFDPWHERERRGVRVADRSGSVVLVCEECGDRVVLLGPLSGWRSGGGVFECECGKGLTLTDRLKKRTTRLAAVPDAQKPGPHP